MCMSYGVGSKIGASLGEFLTADVASDGVGWGRCLRVKVILDTTRPLERGRALHVADKTIWVSFKYEKLPNFCFRCGRITHEPNGCSEKGSGGSDVRWGSWLRAESSKSPLGAGFLTGNGRQNRAILLLRWPGALCRSTLIATVKGLFRYARIKGRAFFWTITIITVPS
ncbi:hypothetical protein SLA2020_433860 [Shorea laevis]